MRILCLALGCILLACSSMGARPRMLGRQVQGKLQPFEDEEMNANLYSGNSGEGHFTQKLCHFNPNQTATWAQHYFYNNKFLVTGQKDSVVAFLMIGGEGPESARWVMDENFPYIQWAKKFNAAVFDLEHRFYGQSRPTADMGVESLMYLSSRQAIEDIADFIRFVNKDRGWTNPKWVVFGGSYSGAMALWFRQAHPELVVGAVGSSGPVEAVVDFYRYLEVVENSLGMWDKKMNNTKVTCVDQVRKGFQQMTDLFASADGRDTLTDTFELQPGLNELDLNDNDVQNFFSTIYGPFQDAVQYSEDNAGPFTDGYSVPNVCQLMLNNDPLKGLAAVNEYMATMDGQNFTGTWNNYTEMITFLQDTSFDSDWASARAWTWQTCTEFGYFQSTDRSMGIFGSVTPNNLFINMCVDTFGSKYNADFITESVRQTHVHYGGAHKYAATNVVMPNGDVDPWHALGKLTSDDYSQVAVLIHESAHCGDMYPVSNKTADKYRLVHALAARHLDLWINGPPNPITHLNQTTITLAEEQKMDKLFPRNEKKFTPTIVHLGQVISPEPEQPKRRLPFARPVPVAPEMDLSTADLSGYSAFTFTQPLCHFNNDIANTFQQRFWKNTKYATPGGPNFFMIGGEGPENPEKWILNENITYITYAKKYGATLYLMEHRCYGDSHDLYDPTNKTVDYEMLFCNSWQSLYDVKLFIETINYRDQLAGKKAPWITFGGSYSGALALWSRQFFPDLILGAVGSSGPVEPKADFFEYLEVTERSLSSYSNDCAQNVKTAFAEMQQMTLSGEGRKNLSDLFQLTPAWDENSKVSAIDLQFFFSNIYSAFQGAVQYSGDNTVNYASGYGIPEACSIMLNTSNTPLENVALVNIYMTEMYGDFTGTDNSYSDLITYLRDRLHGTADRTWTYQTCTEFGYFQSTDYGYGIFGSPTPVNLFLQMCADIFSNNDDGNWWYGNDYGIDYSTDAIVKAINTKLNFYGGQWNYFGSNVVAPHGSLDPWHVLAIQHNPDSTVHVIKINGTAHCADMYPARPQDPPALTAARQQISDIIGIWLDQVPTPPTTPPPTGTPPVVTGTGTGTPGTPPTKDSTASTAKGDPTDTKAASTSSMVACVLVAMLAMLH